MSKDTSGIEKTITLNSGITINFNKTTTTKEEKQDLNIYKLYVSSIFNRRLPHILINGKDNKWIFTDIVPDDILTHRFTIDNHIHYLSWKDNTINHFTDRFPILKQDNIYLDLNNFTYVINNIPLEYVTLEINDYIVQWKINSKDNITYFTCGHIVNQLITDTFNNILDNISKIDCIRIPINTYQLDRNKVTHIKVNHDLLGISKDIYIPVLDGLTNVALTTYDKSINKDSKCEMLLWLDNKILYSYIRYTNEVINVKSIRPMAKWFIT